jgi:hypothetical protein
MTHEQTEQDRQLQLEQLFHRNYSYLRELASEDRRLLADDADNIVQALGARLSEYDGDPEDEPFLTWAGSVVRPAVSRISKFYQLLRKHGGAIRGGIRAALPPWNYFDDSSALIEEIFQEIAMLVMADLDSFLQAGTATLETRLYALGRWHTMGYHTLKFRRRQDALERHIMGGGVIGRSAEVFSGTELASIKTDETGRYHAPVDYLKTIRSRRQSAQQDEVSGDLGRMLCPTGCGLQTIAEISDGIGHLSCGHVRGVQIEAAV